MAVGFSPSSTIAPREWHTWTSIFGQGGLMKGFFINKEPQEVDKKARAPRGSKKSTAVSRYDCSTCGLDKTCVSPKMPVYGKGDKGILVIAEAPGRTEDERNRPLIGEAGSTLRAVLERYDVDLDQDCWATNAVVCRPPKNRTPTAKEIKCCHTRLDSVIRELKPSKILLLGKVAAESFLMYEKSTHGNKQRIGWITPDQNYKAWVSATYHPSFLNRKQDNRAVEKLFSDDIRRLLQHEEDFPEYSDLQSKIRILRTDEDIDSFLDEALECEEIAIDFETTGLKPYATGHRIVSMSISDGANVTGAFMINSQNPGITNKIQKLLRGSKVKKIGHNIKFESVWCNVIWGYGINGWSFDTMIGAHILNNTTGITGLKFQSYVNFGVSDYSVDIEQFLKAKGSNGFNSIDKAPVDQLLLYNAMDSLLTFMLAKKQRAALDKTPILWKGYNLMHTAIQELTHLQIAGIRVDSQYYQTLDEHLSRRLVRLHQQIQKSPEAELWRSNEGTDIGINSNVQLEKLLFTYLKHKSIKQTQSERNSTDKEVLEKINIKFTRDILAYRKLHKLRSTYLGAFIEEACDGFIHPFFNLHTVRTYRSSSSNPNFQNIPKRDDEAQRLIRSGIIPRPGRQILEVDFSGIEVRISACYHHDSRMIKYINDPTTDMHRDMAMQLFLIDKPEDVTKRLRQAAKNGFVFPEFYGDYFGNCAANMWGQMNAEEREGLKQRGIKGLRAFENHVKTVEDDFWYNRFVEYTEWKEKTWKEYQKKGYVELFTGFRCCGLMDKKDVFNYPIQGTAFHVLLWTLCNTNKMIRERGGFESQMIGQIHDSMVFDIVPEEKDEIKAFIGDLVRNKTRKEWDWLIVPLDIEADITEVDGNWYIKKKEEI